MLTSFSSTRAIACAIAGVVAGAATTLAALVHEPPTSSPAMAVARASAAAGLDAAAPDGRLRELEHDAELVSAALAAIPGLVPQPGRLEPVPTPSRADLAARRPELATASRGAGRPGSVLAVWPAGGPITGTYGEPRATHRHAGIDLAPGYGAPVVAAGTGTVVAAGWASSAYAGYGMIVLIDHGNGVQTLSAHLSSVAVAVGQVVAAGERVGAVGTTGQVTGPHLHFEVRVAGTSVNPLHWLPAL